MLTHCGWRRCISCGDGGGGGKGSGASKKKNQSSFRTPCLQLRVLCGWVLPPSFVGQPADLRCLPTLYGGRLNTLSHCTAPSHVCLGLRMWVALVVHGAVAAHFRGGGDACRNLCLNALWERVCWGLLLRRKRSEGCAQGPLGGLLLCVGAQRQSL